MKLNLPHRYRFIAQRKLVGDLGQYKKDIDWVVQGKYKTSNGPVFQRAIARWIASLEDVDTIRFDGDGAGVLSSGVLASLKFEKKPKVVCSEFSPKLQKILKDKGHCDEIIDDGLIPEEDGGTAVVIANQFLDALPFTVMRRTYPSGTIQELSIDHNGRPYYETLKDCVLDPNAASDPDRMTGVFAYSPARSNYVRHMLSRSGLTYLAIIDWGFPKGEQDYLSDVFVGNGLAHSSTSTGLLRRLAAEHSAKLLYSDTIITWRHMGDGLLSAEDSGYISLTLTIIRVFNDHKKKNLTCRVKE